MKNIIRIALVSLSLVLLAGMGQARADEWTFDPVHSGIYFDIKHVYSTTRGQFEEFSGTISIDPETHVVKAWNMEVVVKSIDTDNQQRDNHLRGADFFDEGKHPRMTFASSKVTHITGDRYEITGNLTIKDVTRKVTVPFTFLGARDNPMNPKQVLAGYEAVFTIDRLAYHVGTGKFYEMGVVGKDVNITLTFEVLRDK
jgi:polyisoprenoid-binding protein YceI